MKLLSKTNRYYFFFTALILVLGGVIFYFIISKIIKNEISEVLENELSDFVGKAKSDASVLNHENTIEFEITAIPPLERADNFSEILIVETDDEEETVPYLQLKAVREIGTTHYEIILRESLIESEDILFGVCISMILLFVFILTGLLLLNNYLSKKLWEAFYINISQVTDYNLSRMDVILPVKTDIDEFRDLNDTLIKMTERIKNDFVSLKEFTENASHEIQTPLAIIKTNIDWLLQNVTEEKQVNDLVKIERAANRIAKINQALVLLTKIEKHHFAQLETLNFNHLLEQSLSDFKDFIDSKKLKVNYVHPFPVEKLLNRDLMQILMDNVISNAIRHNLENGYINITLDKEKLVLENPGIALSIDPDKLFERFTKANQSAQSTGLGLSIIKKICDQFDFEISYDYFDERHIITIIFPE